MKQDKSADEPPPIDLSAEIAALLNRDFGKLESRIRTLEHQIETDGHEFNLRVHYPAFRDKESTIYDLVELIYIYLPKFALPQSEIEELESKYGKISADDYGDLVRCQTAKAADLFKKAQEATNRNGEAGELLLYLLTEWVLRAPQIIAKMSLKTNPEMPVHGADGVHVRFSEESKRLEFLWGESKLYKNVSAGIKEAVKSILETIGDKKIQHEFELVQRNISFSGLSSTAQDALLHYLDPFEEASNQRSNISTALIGFDYNQYAVVKKLKPDEVVPSFEAELRNTLEDLNTQICDAISSTDLANHKMEIFFFPVPSVKDFRNLFQEKIGWSSKKKSNGIRQ